MQVDKIKHVTQPDQTIIKKPAECSPNGTSTTEMVWQSRIRSHPIITSLGFHVCLPFSRFTNSLVGFPRNYSISSSEKLQEKVEDNDRLGLPSSHKLDASISSLGQQLKSVKAQNMPKTGSGLVSFDEMKQRFLNFKKHKYLEEMEHFQTLAEVQTPKFMVIACVDSRVCPSNILGFQPGEAFMVRNVANIVPPLENGPTETNAALQFAVNTLEVENIFIIGHSNCAGIQALMNMQDEDNHSFVEKWVAIAKNAKLRTKADANGLSFDQQCKHCEKESINCSLLNLLTYPWIEERVRKETLSVHGGYYDFLNCTFEKWTLDFKTRSSGGHGSIFSAKDRELWS